MTEKLLFFPFFSTKNKNNGNRKISSIENKRKNSGQNFFKDTEHFYKNYPKISAKIKERYSNNCYGKLRQNKEICSICSAKKDEINEIVYNHSVLLGISNGSIRCLCGTLFE